MWDYDHLFKIIAELVMHHSPSGAETEINKYLMQRFTNLGVKVWCDRADNIIAKIPGKNSDQAIANCIDLLQIFCETQSFVGC
jgi:putative aminopeptidase FrvX